ncbi:Uu.00g008720.m01.CDS01 [Anthostomella pinea]|uniref:Uu.00g008720.m01.CDS01 n=1 Tax=Anthostomella pinea TaxID=933095 RepID=A0AAI8YPV8_9PEZI|nr:Uu.00g008720.m01.CDS01 [Anthostomella pinea]
MTIIQVAEPLQFTQSIPSPLESATLTASPDGATGVPDRKTRSPSKPSPIFSSQRDFKIAILRAEGNEAVPVHISVLSADSRFFRQQRVLLRSQKLSVFGLSGGPDAVKAPLLRDYARLVYQFAFSGSVGGGCERTSGSMSSGSGSDTCPGSSGSGNDEGQQLQHMALDWLWHQADDENESDKNDDKNTNITNTLPYLSLDRALALYRLCARFEHVDLPDILAAEIERRLRTISAPLTTPRDTGDALDASDRAIVTCLQRYFDDCSGHEDEDRLADAVVDAFCRITPGKYLDLMGEGELGAGFLRAISMGLARRIELLEGED